MDRKYVLSAINNFKIQTVISRQALIIQIIIAVILIFKSTDAQIHSSVTLRPYVPSSSPPPPSPSSPSSPSSSGHQNTECSSLALSTCHDIQPVASPSVGLSRSASLTFTQREIGGFKCEDLNFCDDILGFEAILNLHRQLDDDADGDIDISESKEFLRDELKYEHGANDRQRAFHGNDKHINVAELWNAWKISAVHNWTVEEVAQWLADFVELPQYKERFYLYSINGMALPRLAVNQQLASSILGITNVIHRQKLALKATDVVLFGVPKPPTLIKDLVMLALVVFALVVGYFAIRQNRKAQAHFRKMNRDIEALSNAEKQLEMIQNELNRTKQEHETAFREKEHLQEKLKEHEQSLEKGFVPNNDIRRMSMQEDSRYIELEKKYFATLEELKRLENAQRNKQWIPPRQVKELLQMTYEIEIKNYNAKKLRAEAQLREAREECDKLNKKRSSMFGAFRVAHGSSMDLVDATILQARTIMTELTKETHERIQRWKMLEQLCGFDITTNPGFHSLERSLGNSYTAIASNPSQASFMLPHNQSSTTLRDSSDATDFSGPTFVRRTSITETDDGISIMASPQHPPYYDSISSYRNLQSLDETCSARPQALGMGAGQRIDILHRINGTGSDGVERHFEASVNSVSTGDMLSHMHNSKTHCSFESEDFPPSSSSSESNNTSTVVSETGSMSSTSLSTLREKKKKMNLFNLVKKKMKAEKKHID